MDNIFIKAVNLKSWTPETYHSFIISLDLREESFPFFQYLERSNAGHLKNELEGNFTNDSPPGRWIIWMKNDLEMIEERRLEWTLFLKSCSVGKPRIDIVHNIEAAFFHWFHQPEVSRVPHESDRWKFRTVFKLKPGLMNLAMYINLFGILEPWFANELDIYRRVRQCKHCRNFFIQKDKRSIFCKDSCRYRWHDAGKKKQKN